MIRIKRSKMVRTLKRGTKVTRVLEIGGFRVRDHVKIKLNPSLVNREEDVIRIETWKEGK